MKQIITLLLFSALLMSCNSEDDCYEILANVVFLTVQLNDTNANNFFDNENFDVSLLKIVPVSDSTQSIEYSVEYRGDEKNLFFEHTGDVFFNYNGENITDLRLTNTNSETNNCGAITSFSFTAQSNGVTICDCDFNNTLIIALDI